MADMEEMAGIISRVLLETNTTDTDSDTDKESAYTLVWSFAISAITGIVAYSIWMYLRGYKWHAMWAKPKQVLQEEAEAEGKKLSEKKLPPLGAGAFGCISQMMSFSDDELFDLAGMDAMVYLTLLKFSLEFFLYNLPFAIAVMVVNVTAGDNIEDAADDVWMNRLTLGNVREEDDRMWLHFVCVTFSVASACKLLAKHTEAMLKFRLRALSQDAGVETYSVLVERLNPETMKAAGGCAPYFKSLFPGKIASVAELGPGLPAADKEMGKLQALIDNVENGMALRDTLAEEMGNSADAKLAEKKRKVEVKLADDRQALSTLQKDVAGTQQRVLGDQEREGPKALILTFKRREVAVDAVAATLNFCADQFVARPAGTPEELIIAPGNFEKTFWKNKIMHYGVILVSSGIIFSSLVIIIGISWMSNKLGDYVPSALKGLVAGYIPVILTIVYMILVKLILRKTTLMSNVVFQREADRSVAHKFFLFAMLNIFLGITLSGMLINDWDAITSGDLGFSDVLQKFSVAIPKQSTYFITFFMVKTFAGIPLTILNIGEVIVVNLKLKFLAKTERTKKLTMQPLYKPFEYDLHIPYSLLFFQIAISFLTISPLIVPFAIMFFYCMQPFSRYLLIYKHRKPYESNGTMWMHVVNRIHLILYFYLLFMLAIFGVNQGPIQMGLVVPLIGALRLFQSVLETKYFPSFSALPRDISSTLDLSEVSALDDSSTAYTPVAMQDSGAMAESMFTVSFNPLHNVTADDENLRAL